MAKIVDLRTYLLLERAFVRRLQRSWRAQSAPTYAAIAKACTEHRWDEARRLVTDLDMTEVGTENREWITYMLLSCAVFGAGMVSRKKPSFVGVGSFDTFLKQVTTNFLMYLEHGGTQAVQEEALQSIAEDEAKTKAIKWDEAKHPRDREGQFAVSRSVGRVGAQPEGYAIEGGFGPERAKWVKLNQAVMDADERVWAAREAYDPLSKSMRQKYGEIYLWDTKEWGDPTQDSEYPAYVAARKKFFDARKVAQDATTALKAQEPAMKVEVVTNVATSVAERMGVDPSIIYVVHHEPREFHVGDKTFYEGGHYNPATGRIELNAYNISYADAPSVRGITAHEISHAIYHAAKKAADEEFERYIIKAVTPDGSKHSDWYHERFEKVPGMETWRRLKEEYREEFQRDYPAVMALSALAEGQPFTGIAQSMVDEDGHSAYAKAYWTPEARAARGYSYETAINETIAEVTRYITSPRSWNEKQTPRTDSPWYKLTVAMHSWYRNQQDEQEARMQASMAAGMFR